MSPGELTRSWFFGLLRPTWTVQFWFSLCINLWGWICPEWNWRDKLHVFGHVEPGHPKMLWYKLSLLLHNDQNDPNCPHLNLHPCAPQFRDALLSAPCLMGRWRALVLMESSVSLLGALSPVGEVIFWLGQKPQSARLQEHGAKTRLSVGVTTKACDAAS